MVTSVVCFKGESIRFSGPKCVFL